MCLVSPNLLLLLNNFLLISLHNQLQKSHYVRSLAISDDYDYLHESDFNIAQSNDPNSSDDTMSCSDSDSWLQQVKRN